MVLGLHGYREATEARPHLENHAIARIGEGAGDHDDTQGGLRALLRVLTRNHCPQGYRATEQRSLGGSPNAQRSLAPAIRILGKEQSREQEGCKSKTRLRNS